MDQFWMEITGLTGSDFAGIQHTYRAKDLKESIEQTEDGYRNFITDSYFFHPETVGEVKQDMLTSINSFDANIFNNAMMTLIRTGALLEAKPRGKDDIARYVWAETHRVEKEVPAAPVVDDNAAKPVLTLEQKIKTLMGKSAATEVRNPQAPNPPVPIKAPAKPITFKSGYCKDKVGEATANLLMRITEYVTAAG